MSQPRKMACLACRLVYILVLVRLPLLNQFLALGHRKWYATSRGCIQYEPLQLRYTEMHPECATLRALHGIGDRRVCVPPEEGTEGRDFVANRRSVFILSVSVQKDMGQSHVTQVLSVILYRPGSGSGLVPNPSLV